MIERRPRSAALRLTATPCAQQLAGTDEQYPAIGLYSHALVEQHLTLLVRRNLDPPLDRMPLGQGAGLVEDSLRRRAIVELLTGATTRTWTRLADCSEIEVDIDDLVLGDEVVVHELAAADRRPVGHLRRRSPGAPGPIAVATGPAPERLR